MEFRFKVRAIIIKNNARTNLSLTPLLSVSSQQLRCSFSLARSHVTLRMYDREAGKLFQVAAILTIMLGESDFQELSWTVETLESLGRTTYIRVYVYNKKTAPPNGVYAGWLWAACSGRYREEIGRAIAETHTDKKIRRGCVSLLSVWEVIPLEWRWSRGFVKIHRAWGKYGLILFVRYLICYFIMAGATPDAEHQRQWFPMVNKYAIMCHFIH
jgi:hypothetical protein